MATPARSPNPTTDACQSSSSGPVFTKSTSLVCWSPLQPSRTLLGSTCSQPVCKKGDVVGDGGGVGLGRGGGWLSAVRRGVDRPVEPLDANAPAWLSRTRLRTPMSNTTLAPTLTQSSGEPSHPPGKWPGSSIPEREG